MFAVYCLRNSSTAKGNSSFKIVQNRKVRIVFKNGIDGNVYSLVERNIREQVLYIERYDIFVVCVDILDFLNEREGNLCSVFVANMRA